MYAVLSEIGKDRVGERDCLAQTGRGKRKKEQHIIRLRQKVSTQTLA
jgi:hypothetical protein